MQQYILVTGASGYVGNHLVKMLAHAGFLVRAVSTTEKNRIHHTNIEWCISDITKIDSLQPYFINVHAVVHCAARKNDEHDSMLVNSDGTQNVVTCAIQSAVPQFIYISTQSVKLKKQGTYAKTKLAGEEIIKKSTIHYTILRPSVIYSDNIESMEANILQMAKLPVVPLFGNGNSIFYPIHIADLCACIIACIGNIKVHNKTYDIGGNTKIDFYSYIQTIFWKNTIQKIMISIPNWASMMLAYCVQILPKPPVTISNMLGAVQIVQMNTTAMKQDIYTPTHSFVTTNVAQTIAQKEGAILLTYIHPTIAKKDIEQLVIHYEKAINVHLQGNTHVVSYACQKYSFALGLCDALSSWKFPDCMLQKKLLIAAAVWESHPASAAVIFANRKKINQWLLLLYFGTKGSCKLIVSWFAYVCMPNFFYKNCGI